MKVAVRFQECIDLLGLVGTEVVGENLDFLMFELVSHDAGERGQKLGRGVPDGRLAQHLVVFCVEVRLQRQRAAAETFEAMSLGALQRQHRVQPIECLNRRLLIRAENDRILWRIQVQPGNIRRLGLEVRIVGGQIAFEQVQLGVVHGQNASYSHVHVRDIATQFRCRLTRRQVSGAVSWPIFSGACNRPGVQPIGHLTAVAPIAAREQAGQKVSFKPLASPVSVAVAAADVGSNLRLGKSVGMQQDQPRVSRSIGSAILRCDLLLKFHEFARCVFDCNLQSQGSSNTFLDDIVH